MIFEKDTPQETPAASMACPWCGREMDLGYLYSGGALSAGRELYVSDEGITTAYKRSWYCSSCGRLVIQLSENARPSSEECHEEFRRYAEQAKGRT